MTSDLLHPRMTREWIVSILLCWPIAPIWILLRSFIPDPRKVSDASPLDELEYWEIALNLREGIVISGGYIDERNRDRALALIAAERSEIAALRSNISTKL